MRIAYSILILGIVLGFVGFGIAASSGARQFGIDIFLVGFFLGAFAGVYIMLARSNADLGKLGKWQKITAAGFGVIAFGQLLGFALESGEAIADTFFLIGIVVMMFGIAMSILKLMK